MGLTSLSRGSCSVNQIVAEFRKVGREALQLEQKQWTEKVLTTLCKLGEKLDYKTRATGVPDGGSEFLYDAIWINTDSGNRICSVPMVAECEWGNLEQVSYDFQKLLLARSKVRVMVYWTGANREIQEGLFDRLLEQVKTFNGTMGDTYLLIGRLPENTFQFHQIIDQGPGNPPKLKRL